FFIDGWMIHNKPDKTMKTDKDFLERILDHFLRDPAVNLEEAVSSVFKVLSCRVSAGEIRKVRLSLPEKIRDLWSEEWINAKNRSNKELSRTDQKSIDPKYEAWLAELSKLSFVQNRENADHFLKGVLGTLASRLDTPYARELTSQLPGPLTFERLRGHQTKILGKNIEEFIGQISQQFKIDGNESVDLIKRVFDLLKKEVRPDVVKDIESALPWDWQTLIEVA
ncbi:MAG: hypothetical protein JWQ35_569, partial [Bacteriovoracaceae bacterium]|nr:hypothetical protein [Bacteriovoracaceae bacterium]